MDQAVLDEIRTKFKELESRGLTLRTSNDDRSVQLANAKLPPIEEEFLRFLAVACVVSHSMPSKEIDAVWHRSLAMNSPEETELAKLTDLPELTHVECAPSFSQMEKTRQLVAAAFGGSHLPHYWNQAAGCQGYTDDGNG